MVLRTITDNVGLLNDRSGASLPDVSFFSPIRVPPHAHPPFDLSLITTLFRKITSQYNDNLSNVCPIFFSLLYKMYKIV